MSRYIKAEMPFAFISRLMGCIPMTLLDEYEKNGIDIVFCKECKHKRINEDGETRYYYCALEDRPNRQWSVDDTDYCSWGEVRDE